MAKDLKIVLENLENRVPWSQEAEEGVLGAMLIDKDAIDIAVRDLNEDCFHLEAHRNLFKAVVNLYEKNVVVDPVTLADQLEKDGTIDQVGGRANITDIFGSVPTSAHVEYHSRIVMEKHILRRLISSCSEIVRRSYEPVEDVESMLDEAEHEILKIQDFRLKDGIKPITPIIGELINDMEQRQLKNIEMTGIPSGFFDLDKMTVGFQNSDLIIVAGRPGMGKTSFCLNIATSLACRTSHHPEQVPVAVFSLEMSQKQLVQRLLSSQSSVTVPNMRKAKLTDMDWIKLNDAANLLHDAPIFIDDTPSISILELRAKARRLKKQHKIGVIIVDYLQLMRVARRNIESRQQEISEISRSLKALAKELDIPVVALSQLSRQVEGRQDKRPQLADLRESGAIEQDADMVIFIYRPEVYEITEADGRSTRGIAEILIEKNRNGPTGSVELHFVGEFTRFENLSFQEDPYGG